MGKKVLVTGATGFLGNYLCRYLIDRQFSVVAASRNLPEIDDIEHFKMGNLEEKIDWTPVLKDIDAVVHLAGRVHQMQEQSGNEHLYFNTNVDATMNLARQCAQAGVRRFIFAGSVKAMGEGGDSVVFSEKTECRPKDAYGRSKLEAEKQLCGLADKTDLKVLILRLPLVYGPEVKGNMASLINLVKNYSIVAFGGLNNRRSFLAVHNFSSAVATVVNSEKLPEKVYLLSDDEPLSTTALVNNMIRVFAPKTRNIKIPGFLWRIAAACPFIGPKVVRLTGSFEVDSSAFCRDFAWKPPFTMQDQFEEMKQE